MKRADVERWGRYFEARDQGLSAEAAARRAKLSASSAYRFERGDQSSGGLEAAAVLGVSVVGGMLLLSR